jgi:TRAP-type uncharacterized transport system fused permease subunit
VLVAALGAPALADLGVPLLAAHLIIFWFSQDSTITPPICMTAFVAARIADAPPMRTGWQAVLMAKPLYIIPFAFAYGNLIDTSFFEVAFDVVVLVGTFIFMPLAVEGFWNRRLTSVERILWALASTLAFISCIGPAVTASVAGGHARRHQRRRAPDAPPGPATA